MTLRRGEREVGGGGKDGPEYWDLVVGEADGDAAVGEAVDEVGGACTCEGSAGVREASREDAPSIGSTIHVGASCVSQPHQPELLELSPHLQGLTVKSAVAPPAKLSSPINWCAGYVLAISSITNFSTA